MAKLTSSSVLRSSGGMEMPIFGLGTWQSLDKEVEIAVHAALDAGYRLIDTAFRYNNEAVIGKVLAEVFAKNKLKREDIFITTKLPPKGLNPKYVRGYIEKELKALQLDYVDLYLLHSPVGVLPIGDDEDYTNMELDINTDLLAVWKEMEKLVDDGLAKAIGVSNFNVNQIERILKIARIPPANLQIELNLYHQCQEEREFCHNHGITVTSYGSLGSPGVPKGRFHGYTAAPMEDPVVRKIAEAHGKSSGQVLLRHLMQLGVAVIPKSCNPERLQQNIQVFDFQLTVAEMAQLNGLDLGEEGRRFDMPFFQGHPEFPYPACIKKQ